MGRKTEAADRVVKDLIQSGLMLRKTEAAQGLVADKLSKAADRIWSATDRMTSTRNVQEETHVIGSALAGEVMALAATKFLMPEVFDDPLHKIIWERLQQMGATAASGAGELMKLVEAITPLVEVSHGPSVSLGGDKETETKTYLMCLVYASQSLGHVDRSIINVVDRALARTEKTAQFDGTDPFGFAASQRGRLVDRVDRVMSEQEQDGD